MKKIFALVLVLALIFSVSACGKAEITMQEIYDAGRNDALLKNHESVYVQYKADGEFSEEIYITKDCTYDNFISSDFAMLSIKDACYLHSDGVDSRIFFLSHDDVTSNEQIFAEEFTESVLFWSINMGETIKSATKKGGRITVVSTISQETTDVPEYEGPTSATFEYQLDAKTLEPSSIKADCIYGDTSYNTLSEVKYDVEAPEMLKMFLEYDSQTENTYTVTVVINPGTDKEVSRTLQMPKGLSVYFFAAPSIEEEFELFADAACTVPFDDVSTDSDFAVYVKWGN